MPHIASETLAHSLESLFAGGSVAGLSDRQLLERFNAARDGAGEAAFAALVARLGPMVLDLCHKLLGDLHDAEDAFQAVFLVLAHKARSIRDPDLLANWLYGVAVRTARCAKAELDRRRKKEEAGIIRRVGPGSSALLEPMAQPAEQPSIDREQAEALHDEIRRLPGSFRLPVVLCYFEGLTLEEAARRLNCPAGTLRSRLARAREKLRRGLTRHGVTLSTTALGAALAPRSASASISSQLCETTTRAAFQFAVGQTTGPFAAAVAQEVVRAMLFHKLKLISLALLLLGAVATSAGYLTRAPAVTDEPKTPVAIRQTPAAARPDDEKPGPGRMFVTGRVLDPQGKPVPGATVVASVQFKFLENSGGFGRPVLNEIAHADADGAGHFRIDAPRTSSSRNEAFVTIALAPGFGVGWVKIDPNAERPAADITLAPEQVIQGRLFDVKNRPAQGVVVSVSAIGREVVSERSRPITDLLFNGVVYEWSQINALPAWPKPAITEADGRFTIRGVGRRLQAGLSVIDPRFPLQNIDVETNDAPGSKLVTEALEPAKVVSGRVTDAETGRPVPHAQLRFVAMGALIQQQRLYRTTRFEADADGRFRANPSRGERFQILASPPDVKTYLQTRKTIDWPKGAVAQTVDLALDRGAAIRGTVVEEGTGRAVAGAAVTFMARALTDVDRLAARLSNTLTADDGSFEFAVLPRAGHLAIQAPNDDYVLREKGILELSSGKPGGLRHYSNSFIECEPKLNGPALDFQIALRRGVTVAGRIVGPDDRPVQDVWIIGRTALAPGSSTTALRAWWGTFHGEVPAGQFEVHGLDPDIEIPVHFLEPKRRLGALVRMSGKSMSGGPLSVHLKPCGAATARLVDGQGRPVANYGRNTLYPIRLVITPGPEYPSRDPEERKLLSGESDSLTLIDPINYPKAPVSDEKGRINYPALIPGAIYRISDYSSSTNAKQGDRVRKEFTVKPGETLDLGDILIEKPVSGN